VHRDGQHGDPHKDNNTLTAVVPTPDADTSKPPSSRRAASAHHMPHAAYAAAARLLHATCCRIDADSTVCREYVIRLYVWFLFLCMDAPVDLLAELQQQKKIAQEPPPSPSPLSRPAVASSTPPPV
jgi:hypothetical protein